MTVNPIIFTNKNYPPICDNEIFVNISKFVPEIKDYYYISNCGRIFNSRTNDFNKPFYDTRDNSGNYYARIKLATIYGQQAYSIHRLVISCFRPELGPINQPMQVNNIDGNKGNNYINPLFDDRSNLEWNTASENILHAFKNGLNSQIGENNSCCKITEETVLKIADLIMKNIYSDKQIADIIGNGVTQFIVSNIRNKNSWEYLTKNYSFPKRKVSKNFTDQDIHNFCQYLKDHKCEKSKKELCKDALKYFGFDVSDSNINAVLVMSRGLTYKNIRSQYDF